jgi:hypothetical protein
LMTTFDFERLSASLRNARSRQESFVLPSPTASVPVLYRSARISHLFLLLQFDTFDSHVPRTESGMVSASYLYSIHRAACHTSMTV